MKFKIPPSYSVHFSAKIDECHVPQLLSMCDTSNFCTDAGPGNADVDKV